MATGSPQEGQEDGGDRSGSRESRRDATLDPAGANPLRYTDMRASGIATSLAMGPAIAHWTLTGFRVPLKVLLRRHTAAYLRVGLLVWTLLAVTLVVYLNRFGLTGTG